MPLPQKCLVGGPSKIGVNEITHRQNIDTKKVSYITQKIVESQNSLRESTRLESMSNFAEISGAQTA